MNSKQFNEVLRGTLAKVERILGGKAAEYATDDERLQNFKTAAALLNKTPEQALMGMLAKHTVSVYDMMGSGREYPLDLWDEKIIDHINYLILLRAIVEERATETSSEQQSFDIHVHNH